MNILLIRQYQQTRPRQFLLSQYRFQFHFTHFQTSSIGTIHHPNHAIGLFKVIPPIGTNGLLSTNIPNIETVGFMFECFDVEAQCGGDGVNGFGCQASKEGGFAGVV
jgi:hypothetical protein